MRVQMHLSRGQEMNEAGKWLQQVQVEEEEEYDNRHKVSTTNNRFYIVNRNIDTDTGR